MASLSGADISIRLLLSWIAYFGDLAKPLVVIHGRSKERSDAAQTRGSMPRLQRVATVQNSAPLRSRSR
ncbi:hypothetical protein FJ419_02995 [Mesorhizobium sp. B2-6-2]|nr:hypothetical protein FJ419_02995 [Mesorhizobium sp. B2-6-2]